MTDRNALAKFLMQQQQEPGGLLGPLPPQNAQAWGLADLPPVQEARSYNPPLRNKLAGLLMGDAAPSPSRRSLVEGLLGGNSLQNTGLGLLDFTPAGMIFGMDEAARQGDVQGAMVQAMPGGAAAKAAARPVRAFHSTYQPFDTYDFSRLGEVTHPNVSGTSVENYGMNLAKLGAWASERPVSKQMGANVTLPVDVGGKGKEFQSLERLEKAVRDAGGPEKLRASLLERGYGHIRVKDDEFGTNSFIGLSPDFFKIAHD